jgi:hypothetical protein
VGSSSSTVTKRFASITAPETDEVIKGSCAVQAAQLEDLVVVVVFKDLKEAEEGIVDD